MNNLFTFLTDLAVNPHGQINFAHNPQAVMMLAGLNETEQATLTSQNEASITAIFVSTDNAPSFAFREPDSDPSPDSDSYRPSFAFREPDTDSSPDTEPLIKK